VRECPRRAKRIRNDLESAKALAQGGRAAASVAPSFAALYGGPLALRLPSALRRLGFAVVGETAAGAEYITERSFAPGRSGRICTACPAAVSYVEKYRPRLRGELIGVASPMVAHGRLLKALYPGVGVVFIGPCAAKKAEARREENRDAVDCALTFEELAQWLGEEGVNLEQCPESGFDYSGSCGKARLFPMEGGMLAAGGKDPGPPAGHLPVSGARAVMDLLGDEAAVAALTVIEPLFCAGGCVNGPALGAEGSLYTRRARVAAYAASSSDDTGRERPEVPVERAFTAEPVDMEPVPQSAIEKIFETMGKTDPEQRPDCGACGYPTCEENAAAIARGMAEPEMCMPYMRRLAQQRTDRIIETMPCGVVILDAELNMLQMNPAFMKMFMCGGGILGRRVSYLLKADGYEAVQSGAAEKYESVQVKYGIKFHELIYALRENGQYAGIYSDITKLTYDPAHLDAIKTQTLRHAQEFLEHQVSFSQEMAHFLGKSAAKSEEIAKQLIGLYSEDG
jgi:PAS domain-containing protein